MGYSIAGIVHRGNHLIDPRLTLFRTLGDGGSRYIVREYHTLLWKHVFIIESVHGQNVRGNIGKFFGNISVNTAYAVR